MSDDLVKRLRSMLEGNLQPSPIGKEAADRIEELEAKLEKAVERDHALALVAETEALIMEEAIDWVGDHDPDLADKMKAEAKTPDAMKALAAREARDRKVREEALREALAKEDSCGFVDRDDMLALIEGETDD